MPPGNAAAPGGSRGRTESDSTGSGIDIEFIGIDRRTEAPDAEDRLDREVIEAARERGFAIAVRCGSCGQWLVAAKSVALHLGPVCRSRSEATA